MAGEIEIYNQTKTLLNEVGTGFCLAKWLQVTLHLHNGYTHSCHHPRTHKIPLEEIKDNPGALHNTKHKQLQQQKMIDGERPGECQYCWNVEDMDGDHISDRYSKSADHQWAGVDKIHTVLEKAKAGELINPSYVEVSFSNLCNFKCSYCSPVYSSTWTKEIEEHGPYKLTNIAFNDLNYIKSQNEMPMDPKADNPYVNTFWEWWPSLVNDLKVFRITGGEPLLERNTFKVLDMLYETPKPDMEFSVNSNGCVPDAAIDRYISKLGRLINEKKIGLTRFYTSVDTHGEQAEYIRNGLDYAQWYRNIDKILTELPETKVTVMCATNLMSVVGFKKLLEDITFLKEKHYTNRRKVPITLDMSIVRWPAHSCAAILPPEYADLLDESVAYMLANQEGTNGREPYKGFYPFEIEKMRRFVSYIRSGVDKAENVHIPTARRDFYIFVNEHDRRRGTDFLKTFPELEPFYRICESEFNKRII